MLVMRRDLVMIQWLNYIWSFAQDWNDLARNAGRRFTPAVAHDPEQSAFDFGDIEMQEHLSKLPHKLKETA
jgi:hypothetical protein